MLPVSAGLSVEKGQRNLPYPQGWAASGSSEPAVAQSSEKRPNTDDSAMLERVLWWGSLLPPRCLQILRTDPLVKIGKCFSSLWLLGLAYSKESSGCAG